jgi:hypothetical protein
MLFGPERDERRRQVAAHGGKPVDAGVAGGAEGDQPFSRVMARVAVMDMDPPGIGMRGSAGLALATIPEQDGFALAAEAGPRAPGLGIAGPAEAGDRRLGRSTRAKQALLWRSGSRNPAQPCRERKCSALLLCQCQARIIPEKTPYR